MNRLKFGLAGILLLAVAANAGAEPFTLNGKQLPETVASVNGVKLDRQILISEVLVYRQMNLSQNHKLSEAKLVEYSHEALDRLIDQELIFQKAKTLNIKIDPATLNRQFEEIRKQFPSEEMFQAALEMQGLTEDLLKTKFEKQLTEEQFVRQEVAPHVQAGDSDVQAYYQKNLKEFETPEQYEAHHIFAAALQPDPHDQPISDPALRKKAARLNRLMDQDASNKIDKIYEKLQKGADFAELAKNHSEDSSTGDKGGSWGAVTLDDFPKSMADTLLGLKQDEISKPVRSQYGYHILKWTKRIPAGYVPLAEVKSEIMNALLRERTLAEHKKKVAELRNKADIKIFYK